MFLYDYLLLTSTLLLGAFANNLQDRAARNLMQCDSNDLDPTSTGSGYHQWLSSQPPEKYTNHIFIPTASDACNGIAFHWKIDKDSKKILIAVAAKATGWAAIGFSETGGMRGADIVYYEAAKGILVDSHVGDHYKRPTEDVFQDWMLNMGQVTDDGIIVFEAERSMSTTPGHEDHEIVDDSSAEVLDHKIIGAWGDSSSISFHGKNVVHTSVQLFSSSETGAGNGLDVFRKEMAERAENSSILKLSNYAIPQDETTYHGLCFTTTMLVDLGLYKDASSSAYIIGMEFLIDPAAIKYLHHILLYGHGYGNDACRSWSSSVLAAWTPGDDFVLFPRGMGLQVGNTPDGSGFSSLSLEFHFDNVDGDANMFDNGSGIKIYHTNESVDHEIGLVVMGDGQVDLKGQSIGIGKTRHEFACPATCTEENLDVEEVTVFGEYHHMHATGKRIVNEVYREGEIVNRAAIDYYDFNQNGAVAVRQTPYTLKRGDSYKTTCYFESNQVTRFGLASSDEMCMVFIYYYPKQPNFLNCGPNHFESSCKGSHTSEVLALGSNFDRARTDTTVVPSTNSPDDTSPGDATSATVGLRPAGYFVVCNFVSLLSLLILTF